MELLIEEISSLTNTPSLLRILYKDRADSFLDSKHHAECLSPREALGHLIIGEKNDWIPRIRIILENGESSPFVPFDVNGGDEMARTMSISKLLDLFDSERAKSISSLNAFRITTADLVKTGTHPKFGKVTLHQLISTWVAHDLYHIGQICKDFSVPYINKIGPWQEFLNLPNFN